MFIAIRKKLFQRFRMKNQLEKLKSVAFTMFTEKAN